VSKLEREQELTCPECREIVFTDKLPNNSALMRVLGLERKERKEPADELYTLLEAFGVERHHAKLAAVGITAQQLDALFLSQDQLRRTGWTEPEISRVWPELQARTQAFKPANERMTAQDEAKLRTVLRGSPSDTERVHALRVFLRRRCKTMPASGLVTIVREFSVAMHQAEAVKATCRKVAGKIPLWVTTGVLRSCRAPSYQRDMLEAMVMTHKLLAVGSDELLEILACLWSDTDRMDALELLVGKLPVPVSGQDAEKIMGAFRSEFYKKECYDILATVMDEVEVATHQHQHQHGQGEEGVHFEYGPGCVRMWASHSHYVVGFGCTTTFSGNAFTSHAFKMEGCNPETPGWTSY
jgi:hypothetical protein